MTIFASQDGEEMTEDMIMEEILLITNTNMGEHAGNVTLLERRAEAMYTVGGYYTRMLVYKGVPQKEKPIKTECYSVEYLDRYEQLEHAIASSKPKYIVLYGRKVSLLTNSLRRSLKKQGLQSSILMDVQGCVEEKWEYAKNWKQKLMYPAHEVVFRLAINQVDGAFVVSDEMMDNCQQKRIGNRPIKYYKVRCGVNDLLSLEKKLAYRHSVRQTYGISDDTVVFVFSGFRKPWQRLDDILADMKQYDARLEKAHFMLFCDSNPEFEAQVAECFPKGNYTVKLLNKEEYLPTLCACDVGYLIRAYNETNRVAFPNKFSEYLSCGLLIAMNGALPEPMRILKRHGVAYIDTDNGCLEDNLQLIQGYCENIPQHYETAVNACGQELLYEAQIRHAGL